MVDLISITVFLFFALLTILSMIILVTILPRVKKELYSRKKLTTDKKTVLELEGSLSLYMAALAQSKDEKKIKRLLSKIRREAEKILENEPDSEQSLLEITNAESILKWLNHFSTERHLSDLKYNHISYQIRYDNHKQEFKLMIPR